MLETVDLEKLEPYITGEISQAPECGIPELDRHFRWKPNFTIVGGAANTGKTIGFLRILYEWADTLGKKSLCFCNENTVTELVLFLTEQKLGQWINQSSRTEIEQALAWVNEHFQFLPVNYNTTLRSALELSWKVRVNLFPFDVFFLDPYNSVASQAKWHEHYYNCGVMRDYVKAGSEAGMPIKLCVSMHVYSAAQRERDKNGNIKTVHLTQLENGSLFFNRCDDGIVIHRATQDEKRRYITEIHVQKIKQTRTGGECTPHNRPIEMEFRKKTGDFRWKSQKELAAGF